MIPVLMVVVRFLMVLFLVRLGLRLFAAARRGARARTAARTAELVRDRVCNTFLPRDRAVFGTVGGRTEPFCSAACRDAALPPGSLDSQARAVQSLAGSSEGRPGRARPGRQHG